MLPLWRVTRNRFGKRLHARLDDAGVTVSRLDEYRAPVPAGYEASSPDGASIRPADPAAVPESVPTDELVDGETALVAADGGVVGYLFVSVDATVPVPELGTELAFDGGYVRRLYVDPDHRRRGIATGLVDAAKAHAADRGADDAAALVAVDNRPSQWTFEAQGFRRVARHAYDRLWGLERRRRRPLPDGN
ncbi:GNAT family N-acetyltransferase [Haloplanus halophilus]|uniref:GNAT family N-acetyltransferase n=1 Tax=Haloplanus halophilus TaxID=2949993 RepID=UPI00203CB16E|nr:GNAT family N-acetyltransferase [Haloplanus sp. GDY1]